MEVATVSRSIVSDRCLAKLQARSRRELRKLAGGDRDLEKRVLATERRVMSRLEDAVLNGTV